MKLVQNNKKNCTFGMLKIVRVVKIDFFVFPSQAIVVVFFYVKPWSTTFLSPFYMLYNVVNGVYNL